MASLLLDKSAWTRLRRPALGSERAAEIADRMEAGEIAVALPFLLEAGYSARNAAAHAELLDQLVALPYLGFDRSIEQRAIQVQSQLSRSGHHRLPVVDLITAAIAEGHGVGVLHYDADYDLIRERTDLRFESVWLVERGSL